MRWIAASMMALTIGLAAGVARGDVLDADAAVAALVGQTWHGTNDDGEDYWFRHSGGPNAGSFIAKFAKGSTVLGRARGTWARRDDRICWHWPGSGQTQCYVEFERDGKRLTMTREDGLVHSGILREGGPEDLSYQLAPS